MLSQQVVKDRLQMWKVGSYVIM